MLFFDFLQQLEPGLSIQDTKIHLARFNGSESPMDVYIAGDFENWQAWQNRRNFEKPFVVSLIDAGAGKWLYVGLFHSMGCRETTDPKPRYVYDLHRLQSADEFAGRLYVRTSYKERMSYPLASTLADDLKIIELLPEKVTFGKFPGFKSVSLSKQHLDIVVGQSIESWRAALSSVKGIYLITDRSNGKLYVGKASGEDGIWGRWCQYVANGHGNNLALRAELGLGNEGRMDDFSFSLLEIADIQSTEHEIARRESHWKEILLSRRYGYNLN